MKTTCSGCNDPLEPHRVGKQRYCLACHRAEMKAWRRRDNEARKRADEELRRLRAKVNRLAEVDRIHGGM